GTATSTQLSRPLRPAQTLWWRVVAETAGGIRRVTRPAGPLFMPAWVRLQTLHQAADQFTSATRPRLIWSALPAPPPMGPLLFDIEVLSAHDGAVVQTIRAVRDTAVTLPDPLDY